MAVTVTNSTTVLNTAVEKTFNAATADTANESEVFTITPTKADYKSFIEIKNAGSNGTITYSIAAGDLWAGKVLTGSVAQGKTSIIQVEGGKVMQDNGTILVTLTPASGKKLLTDHAATIQYVQTL
jgi:hypothetical protein